MTYRTHHVVLNYCKPSATCGDPAMLLIKSFMAKVLSFQSGNLIDAENREIQPPSSKTLAIHPNIRMLEPWFRVTQTLFRMAPAPV